MKVCCGNGKPYDSITEAERLGGCNNDHCFGPIEEYVYLQFCGKFHTNECTSSDDLAKLLDKPTDWKEWIGSQIEQEGFDKYKDWYARMLQRGAICNELIQTNDKLFGEKE